MSCWSKDKRIDQWNKQRAYKKATDVEVLGSWERTGGDGKRTVFLIIMIMEKLGIHTGKKNATWLLSHTIHETNYS